MRHDIYFLSSMIKPGYWENLTVTERKSVTSYLEDMQHGPADGEMDISWQEDCRGYYKHLEILEHLKVEDRQPVDDYKTLLQADIIAWLAIKPGNYMVSAVSEMLTGENGLDSF